MRLVPAISMKVVGAESNWSVSLAAIQAKRTESRSARWMRPALTKCQRNSESAVAQPTQEPVLPWSPTFHHVVRRSFELGIVAGAAASRPACSAWSYLQSRSVSRDGSQLRIRLTRFGLATEGLLLARSTLRGDRSMAANLDAFVSYSRRDGAFVAQLKEALEARGRNVWIDADDIPAGAPWRQELGTGIEAADAFVFVISPDSVVSPECLQELTRATELGKRLVPVLHEATTSVPPALAALQYVDVAQNRDLALSVAEIDAAIETDHEWVRAHTEWLARALRWQAGGRDDSALLRGSELDAAERWLAGRKNGKQPPPTDLQTSFILSGRRSERRRLRLLVGLSLAAVAVSLGLAVLALVARNDAIEQRDEANEQRNLANEQRNQALSRELAARARPTSSIPTPA